MSQLPALGFPSNIPPWNSKGKLSMPRLRAVRTCLPQVRICQVDPGRPTSGNCSAMDRKLLSLVAFFSLLRLSSYLKQGGGVTTSKGVARLPPTSLDPMRIPLCFSTVL